MKEIQAKRAKHAAAKKAKEEAERREERERERGDQIQDRLWDSNSVQGLSHHRLNGASMEGVLSAAFVVVDF